MRIVELIIDEKDETSGIDAVSVVESPAIESDFIALKKHEIELKEVDAEKRILMGAALIPNKQIYRKNDKNEEYYIYFSEETVRKASVLFFMNSNQNNATLEHKQKLDGMSVVESWIVEGSHDKSMNYGFNFPKGTWVISMKVNNDEIWNKVKLGEVKGFSIEGYFADKLEMSLKNNDMEEKVMIEKIKSLIEKSELKNNKVELALIDDLKKGIANAKKEEANLYSDFKATLNGVIIKARETEIKYNVLLSNINEPLFQSEKQAKELGLDFKATDFYKQAQSVIQAIEGRKDVIDKIQANIQKFGF